MTFKDNTTLLLSGGPDSVTLAKTMKLKGLNFRALSFLHNPMGSNIDEINSAKSISKELEIDHEVIDVSALYALYRSNETFKFSLGGAKDCIPNGLKQTPLSVHLMFIMAAMNAISNSSNSITWAIHKDDLIKVSRSEIEKMIHSLEEMISIELGQEFKIIIPFIELRKKQIFEIADDIDLNLESTISCFISKNNKPCGRCLKCIERNIALTLSNENLLEVWESLT